MMAARIAGSLVVAGLLAGCSGAPAAPATPEPAAFDLAAVEAKFEADCKNNAAVGTWFCDPVDLTRLTGEGTILRVPTNIDPKGARAQNDGDLICGHFAGGYADASGALLGYETIGILDSAGGNLAACTITTAPDPVVPAEPTPVPLSVKVTKITKPARAGQDASVTVKTAKGAECGITVTYDSGDSDANGLGFKTAKADGLVTWKWMVGRNTQPQTAEVYVFCDAGARSGDVSADLVVK